MVFFVLTIVSHSIVFILIYRIVYFLVPSEKVVCYKCGLKMFKELAYQYRAQMKQDDIFPVAMRNRDDCYYGRKCRTQYTKPGHAQKLNHACEQTKF